MNNKFRLHIQDELMKRRESEKFHHAYAAEVQMFDAVRYGSLERLEKSLNDMVNYDLDSVQLATTTIRHKKNMLIVLVSLTIRAMIDGGIPSEESFIISDIMINQIELLESMEDLGLYQQKILEYGTLRVQEHKKASYSPEIFEAQNYIILNIYQKITVQDIADLLHLNVTYLSTKFKKEVGITLSKFIQRQKVEEAKYLILHSDYSFSDIYTLLQFSDQSHFIRVFKEHTGFLPGDYKKHHLSNL